MKRNFILLVALVYVLSGCKKEDHDTTPTDPNPSAQVDNQVTKFMMQYSIPGVAVAITKNGKLVYAKGYGKADVAANTAVTNSSLFRIAGVSQPITSAAIMKLVEAGKLSLEATVFGAAGILGTQYGTQPYGTNITNVTVRHLLQHTGGGWAINDNDPLFADPSLSAAQLLSWTLDHRPLRTVPGTTYAHSNFGYFVLGRVIEKLSGLSYEHYVKTAVLQPAGITEMQIGGNTEAERRPNEVKYYGQEAGNPCGFNLSRMDAADGWHPPLIWPGLL